MWNDESRYLVVTVRLEHDSRTPTFEWADDHVLAVQREGAIQVVVEILKVLAEVPPSDDMISLVRDLSVRVESVSGTPSLVEMTDDPIPTPATDQLIVTAVESKPVTTSQEGVPKSVLVDRLLDAIRER